MVYEDFMRDDLAQLTGLQPPDWGNLIPRFEYFLRSPLCRPVKLAENGQLAAIGTVIFHTDTAWLACIVVHPEHRKKGLGNLITKSLIADIDPHRFSTIYLDATEFGYPVYKKLDFEVECDYLHFARNQPAATFETNRIFPFEEKFREGIYAIDAAVSGENRAGILSDFIQSALIYSFDGSRVSGFYIPDWGDGPVLASDSDAAYALMSIRMQEKTQAVVPAGNASAIKILQENGFKLFKTSRRMYLGRKRSWNEKGLFNWISGQLG